MFGSTLRLMVGAALLMVGAFAAGAAPDDRKTAVAPPAAIPEPLVVSPELLAQVGHAGAVETLVFSPDGRLLATGGSDGTLRIWDVRTRLLLRTWPVDGSEHVHVAFSPDSRQIAALLGQSGKVTIRDTSTGKVLRAWALQRQPGGLSWSPDGKLLACGSMQNSVDLCDTSTGKVIRSLRTHGDRFVESLDFSPDSRRLFCAGGSLFSRSNVGEIFDVATGEALITLQTGGPISCGKFSADGKLLVAGCGAWPSPSDLELWDAGSGIRRYVLKQHTYSLTSVAFGPGATVLGLDNSGVQSTWDVPTGKLLRSAGRPTPWLAAALGPNLSAIVTSEGVRLSSTDLNAPLGVLPTQNFRLRTMAVSPDGKSAVVIGRREGEPKAAEAVLWDLRTGQWKGAILWRDTGVEEVAISGDSRTAAVLESAGTVAILDLVGRRFIRRFGTRKAGESIQSLGFAAQGDRIWLAGSLEKPTPGGTGFRTVPGKPIFEIWNVKGERLHDLSAKTGPVMDAALSASGERLWTVTADGTFWERDLATRSERSVAVSTQSGQFSCRFSAAGKLLAVQRGNSVRLWELATRQRVGKPLATEGEVRAVSDAGLVALHHYPDVDTVWDGFTGRKVVALNPGSPILVSEFLPDGKSLVQAASRGVVEVVNPATGLPRATMRLLPERDDAQQWLTSSPSGAYVGSARAEESMRWRVGDQVLAGDHFRATLYQPGRVQQSLTGHPTPDVYRQNLERLPSLQKAYSQQLARLAAPAPKPRPEPRPEPTTPTQRLARALSSWSDTEPYEVQLPRKITELRTHLDQGADPNTVGSYGVTPLMLAARAGDVEFVRELLRMHVNLNLGDTYGATALHEAAEAEALEVVQLLLKAGAELKDPKGRSLLGLKQPELNRALARAVTAGSGRENPAGVFRAEGSATAWLLLYLGADPNTTDAERDSLLNSARQPWLLRMLLRKGAAKHYRTATGYPPLVSQAMSGQLELVKILLEAGANPNVGSAQGWTALTFAAQNGHLDIAKLLIEHQANVNRKSADGRTALHLATGDHLELVRLLLSHGADPNVRDESGYAPLAIAVSQTDAETVKLLLKYRANPQVRTKEGRTLLQLLEQVDPKDQFGVRKILLAASQPKSGK